QVVITVLSVDGENKPDILAAVTVSAALSISKIPWNGPIGVTRVGLLKKDAEEELVINPAATEEEFMELDLIVSSRQGKAVMIEAGAKQVEEEKVDRGIKLAKEANGKIEEAINEWVKEIGEKKVELKKDEKM